MKNEFHGNIACKPKKIRAYIRNPNCVIIHLRPRRPKQYNPAIRRALNHIIPDRSIPTAHADPVRPLLERIRATGPDIVVLDDDAVARQRAFRDVQTRPAARVVGTHILDELVLIRAAHLDVAAAVGRWRALTCAVDLFHSRNVRFNPKKKNKKSGKK
jgi:hypothetical protein